MQSEPSSIPGQLLAPAPSSPNKLYRHPLRDDTSRVGPIEQQLHRLPSSRAVIHGPLVDVHADERVGALIADPTVELLAREPSAGSRCSRA